MDKQRLFSEVVQVSAAEAHNNRDNVALSADNNSSEDNWEVFQRRKRRNNNSRLLAIGNIKSTKIKTVPKCVDLHVYRLHPNITSSELKNILVPYFPEVTCEQLVGNNSHQ